MVAHWLAAKQVLLSKEHAKPFVPPPQLPPLRSTHATAAGAVVHPLVPQPDPPAAAPAVDSTLAENLARSAFVFATADASDVLIDASASVMAAMTPPLHDASDVASHGGQQQQQQQQGEKKEPVVTEEQVGEEGAPTAAGDMAEDPAPVDSPSTEQSFAQLVADFAVLLDLLERAGKHVVAPLPGLLFRTIVGEAAAGVCSALLLSVVCSTHLTLPANITEGTRQATFSYSLDQVCSTC